MRFVHRFFRILGGIALWSFIGTVVLFSAVLIAFQFRCVQEAAPRLVFGILERKFGVRMTASRAEVGLLARLKVYDYTWWDLQGDTLIHVDYAMSSLRFIGRGGKLLSLGHTEGRGALINIASDSAGVLNIKAAAELFQNHSKPKDISSLPFNLTISSVALHDVEVRVKTGAQDGKEGIFDPHNIDFRHINAEASNLYVLGAAVRMRLFGVSLREASGFEVRDLGCLMALDSTHMHFNDLEVTTPYSRLHLPWLHFDYHGWKAMSHFNDSVRMDIRVQPSRFNAREVGYFAPLPAEAAIPCDLSLRYRGKLSDFRVDTARIALPDGTRMVLNAGLVGLPNWRSTVLSVSIDSLQTSPAGIESLVSRFAGKPILLRQYLKGVASLHYRGEIVGFLDDFVAFGTLTSNIGKVGTDLSLAYNAQGHVRFKGRVATESLDIGKLAGSSQLGTTSLDASIDGSFDRKKGLDSKLSAKIRHLSLLGYSYHGIEAEGQLTSTSYSGALRVADSALRLAFNGMVDLSSRLPLFRFRAEVPHADLARMHVVSDSISVGSLNLQAAIQGSNLDNLDGDLELSGLSYRNARGTIRVDSVVLGAHNAEGGKLIMLQSKVLRGILWGGSQYNRVPKSLNAMAQHLLPAMIDTGGRAFYRLERDAVEYAENSPQSSDSSIVYRGEIIVGQLDSILQVLLPAAYVAPGSRVTCDFIPQRRSLDLNLRTDQLRYESIKLNGLRVRGQVRDTTAQLLLALDSGRVASTPFDSVRTVLNIVKNHLDMRLGVRATTLGSSRLSLGWSADFYPSDSLNMPYVLARIDSGAVQVDGRRWRFSPARIVLDTTGIDVSNCHLRHEGHSLSVSGRLSRHPADSVRLQVENFSLDLLNGLMSPFRLEGMARGGVAVAQVFGKPSVKVDMQVDGLRFNSAYIGALQLKGRWAGIEHPFLLGVTNMALDGHQALSVLLAWNPNEEKLRGSLRLDHFAISPLGVLAQGQVQTDGVLSADVQIGGTVRAPRADGYLQFHDAKFGVRMLNTSFATSSRVQLAGRSAIFNGFIVTDAQGSPFRLDGSVDWGNFSNPAIAVKASGINMKLLNTSTFAGELFYGQLYASPSIQATGTLRRLRLDLDVTTNAGTTLSFQLPTSVQAKENQQLVFALSPADSLRQGSQEAVLTQRTVSPRLTLNMGLHVTNDALTQLIINSHTGDMLKARGSGNLHISAKPGQPVAIFGDYTMHRGEFTFTLEGLISKKFNITEGSSIHFNGDPLLAYANIVTVYNTRASLEKLAPAADAERYRRRVPVACKLTIKGRLSNPTLAFDVEIPQADAETQSLLAAALNTDEKKVRQFASLLLLNAFVADTRGQSQVAAANGQTTTQSNGINDALLSTFWELLSNQFNAWLAQIAPSEDAPTFGVGINYRPNTTPTQRGDDAQVSLSMQWKSVNIDANFDVNRANTSSAVAGDISFTKQSGFLKNLYYRAFARSNDDLVFNNLSPYTAGAGVVYSQSFNNLHDLWQQFLSIFVRANRERDSANGEQPATTQEETAGKGR